RTLAIRSYLTPQLLPPPESLDLTRGQTDFRMLMNNSLGCCTIAGALHQCMLWTLNTGLEDTVNDGEALEYYEKWCGYVYGNPATDQGGTLYDVLRAWKAQTLEGNSLDAYANVDIQNVLEVKQAINLFGGMYCGLAFPNSAFSQNVWSLVADDGGLAGGHCVTACGYDATGPKVISWGRVYSVTWGFWLKYFNEGYALISPEWINKNGQSPTGLDMAQLNQDLALIY
ncbi:MAG: hypothetical protein ACYCOU_25200, partial [Sulfobacillus sp.]